MASERVCMRRCVIRSHHICEAPEYVHEARNDGKVEFLSAYTRAMIVDTWITTTRCICGVGVEHHFLRFLDFH